MRLFRPIGLEELVLLFRSGMRRFPPRLPAQPIFYPVLNAAYATQIARDWNAPTGSMAGFVTAFEVAEAYARGFEVHRVGSREALELWVPAEELETFNDHLEGPVRLGSAFFGSGFRGVIPERFGLRGMDARAQFEALRATRAFAPMDFMLEIAMNAEAVFANFCFWEELAADRTRVPEQEARAMLAGIRAAWRRARREVVLGIEGGERG